MRSKKALRYDKQIAREPDKTIASRFKDAFMSNAKWVRLIDKLVEEIDKIKKIEFKRVQHDKVGELFLQEDTTFRFDYWKGGIEGHNSLDSDLGWYEIEYLRFPKVVDQDKQLEQDLIQIKTLIESVGEFVLELDGEALLLICYR